MKRKTMEEKEMENCFNTILSTIEKIDEEETAKTLESNNKLAKEALLGLKDLENILGHILNKLISEYNFRHLLQREAIKREKNDSDFNKRIVIKKYPHDTTEKNELFDDAVESIEKTWHLTKLTTALLYPEVVSIIKQKLGEKENKFLFVNNRNINIIISSNQYAKIFIEDGSFSYDNIGRIVLEFC